MSINGNIAIGEAVGQMANITDDSEVKTSEKLIAFMLFYSNLSLAWSDHWNKLANQYYIDSLNIMVDPKNSVVAAGDWANYQVALQEGQNQMGGMDNLLQENKGLLTTLGNSMDQIYSMVEMPIQTQKALSKELLVLVG